MRRQGKIYIGTSGWSYRHWDGNFYPSEIKHGSQLDFYAGEFATVEINNSFYKMPEAKTFLAWKAAVPAAFIFSVKANRFITHMKKLKVDQQSLNDLFDRTAVLGRKSGPILFQLPPNWKINIERLAEFLSALPQGRRCTFEFRHPSWHCKEVYELLRSHNYAFCIYDIAGFLSPLQVTARFAYIRLHGPGDKYQGSYSRDDLKGWAGICRKWADKGIDTFIYFDNDQLGYAAANARSLQSMIGK